jgi:hypothetical protein
VQARLGNGRCPARSCGNKEGSEGRTTMNGCVWYSLTIPFREQTASGLRGQGANERNTVAAPYSVAIAPVRTSVACEHESASQGQRAIANHWIAQHLAERPQSCEIRADHLSRCEHDRKYAA